MRKYKNTKTGRIVTVNGKLTASVWVDITDGETATAELPDGTAEEGSDNGAEEKADESGELEGVALDSLTIPQLKELAAQMDIDVSGYKKKAEYIAAIEAAED